MSVNEKVLEKLRKILNLAQNQAATQGEVEAAMARAKEIAMQNNIELASVDLTDPNAKRKGIEVAKDEDLKLGVAFWRRYHSWICHIVQEVFGVRIITSRSKVGSREKVHRIWVIGEVTDVAVAKVMFSWLEDLYPKSYRHAVNTFLVPVDNAASQHGYYRGMSAGILEVNKRMEAQAAKAPEAGKWAMVVANKKDAIAKRVEQEFPDLETKASRVRAMSQTAAAAGYARGKQVNLHQVGAGSKAAGELR